ncbi:hypothetical protein METH_03830 [Leisingera methylohalidivorans DSM 14336]|uniref:Uncharacterized protein n=1 Tax=Leisingera methylohalidivorans DSM 14336 TaxID=999552 RepID=V9VVU2_9RHOB|nr:hypothetical protein METH_03830 [Leisingera methylohalidivorans DSM 14336]
MKRAAAFRRAELDNIACFQCRRKIRVWFQNRAQENLCIRVQDWPVDIFGRAKFAQAPLIKHCHAVRQCLDHGKVVADENVASIIIAPKIVQQFQHRSLNRHVKR